MQAFEENVSVTAPGPSRLDSDPLCCGRQGWSDEPVEGGPSPVSFMRLTLFGSANMQDFEKRWSVAWMRPGTQGGGLSDGCLDGQEMRYVSRRQDTRLRVLLVFSVLVIVVVLLCWRAAYLSLGRDNRDRTNFILMMRTPASLLKLEDESSNLQRMSRHIDEYRLIDIVSSLKETSRLASIANLELKAQYEAWMNIKESASSDARAYLEIQRKLAATNQLQAQEIDRLHSVLAQAEKPSLMYSVMTLVVTFVAGVLTSMASDYLKVRFKHVLDALKTKFAR